jgi:hypothetical protein
MPLYLKLDINGAGKIILYAETCSTFSVMDRPVVIANTISQALREFASKTAKKEAA